MIGRAAIHDAYTVARMDHALFPGDRPLPTREDIALRYLDYVEREFARGDVRLPGLTRHLLSLYHGQPGARAWRRTLSTDSTRPNAGPAVIRSALHRVNSRPQTTALRSA
jgi:tRNA-dihydrouridine synthase A